MDPRQAPFREYSTRVRSSWIDYNGHMNDSAYAIAAAEASEIFLAALDLSARYQATTGRTTYTVESHIYYLREATLGERITAETVLVATDTKRLRVRHTLSTPSGPIATAELLYLHVNQQSGRVEPFPDSRQAVLAEVLAAHQT
jgi:acyl-CoA thioester hydrolase